MRIFIDSDGVIFDMKSHCLNRFGADTNNTTFVTEEGRTLTGDEALWANIDSTEDFWTTMPLMHGAADLVDFCRKHDPHATVLTGCPKHAVEFTAEQKRIKYAKHFPGLPVICCLAKDKPLHMVEPGDILIDDFIANVKRWRKAGGVAIYHKSVDQTITELKMLLEPAYA